MLTKRGKLKSQKLYLTLCVKGLRLATSMKRQYEVMQIARRMEGGGAEVTQERNSTSIGTTKVKSQVAPKGAPDVGLCSERKRIKDPYVRVA